MWNCRTSRGSDPCEQKNKCWWCGYGSNTYSNSPVHLQVRGIPIRFWLHMLVKFLPRMCRFGNGSGARVVFKAATFSFLDFLSRWNRMVDAPAGFFFAGSRISFVSDMSGRTSFWCFVILDAALTSLHFFKMLPYIDACSSTLHRCMVLFCSWCFYEPHPFCSLSPLSSVSWPWLNLVKKTIW